MYNRRYSCLHVNYHLLVILLIIFEYPKLSSQNMSFYNQIKGDMLRNCEVFCSQLSTTNMFKIGFFPNRIDIKFKFLQD